MIKSPINKLRPFFDLYGEFNDKNDLPGIARSYADEFIAAGPKGNAAFKNNQHFITWLEELGNYNRRAGLKSMQIIKYEETTISADYLMVKIRWGAKFEKTKDEMIEFDITYVVFLDGESPRIVMYISHDDQEDLMKRKGLA